MLRAPAKIHVCIKRSREEKPPTHVHDAKVVVQLKRRKGGKRESARRLSHWCCCAHREMKIKSATASFPHLCACAEHTSGIRPAGTRSNVSSVRATLGHFSAMCCRKGPNNSRCLGKCVAHTYAAHTPEYCASAPVPMAHNLLHRVAHAHSKVANEPHALGGAPPHAKCSHQGACAAQNSCASRHPCNASRS